MNPEATVYFQFLVCFCEDEVQSFTDHEPWRLGEEVINALYPVLRKQNVDATLAEEDSRTYFLKGEGSR